MQTSSENAYNQYLQVAVTTASREKLLLMLYDGLVINLKRAKQAIEQNDPATAHTFLMKGQNIVTELMSTLKMEYEVSANLFRLYDYLRRRLITANVRKDPDIIEEALGIVTGLRTSWATAARKVLEDVSYDRQA